MALENTDADLETDDNRRDDLLARVEGFFLAADEPVSPRRLAKLMGYPHERDALKAITRLNEMYDRDSSAFRLVHSALGWQLLTRSDLSTWLELWSTTQQSRSLSPTLLKVLAIIAQGQPMTRADIDVAHGGATTELLRELTEMGWVEIVGTEESLGRPKLFGTTRAFLQEFGLDSLADLPKPATSTDTNSSRPE